MALKEKSDHSLGKYHYFLTRLNNNPDSAYYHKKTLEKSIRHFNKAGKTTLMPILYTDLGIYYIILGQTDSAIISFTKALKYNPGDETRKTIYLPLIETFEQTHQYDSILVYGKKQQELCTRLKDTVSLAYNHIVLAKAYQKTNNYKSSLENYKIGIGLYDSAGHPDNASIYCRVASLMCIEYKQIDPAFSFAHSGVKYAQKARNRDLEGYSYMILGQLYSLQKRNNESIDAYKNASNCFSDVGNQWAYHSALTVLTQLYNKTNQQDSAWHYMQKAEEMGNPELLLDSSSSPFYYDEIKQMVDQTVSLGRKEKLEVLAQQKLKQEADALKQKINLIIVISVLLIAVLLLLYNRQRQKTKSERMAHYAKEKENELAVLQKDTEIRLTRKYIDGLENERKRIAKELHDGICNDLLALEMELKSEHTGNELNDSLKILSDARINIRNVSHELMPPAFKYTNLHEMLEDYSNHVDRPLSMNISFAAEGDIPWDNIPQNISYEIYRIAQEVINNSVKHSKATLIDISLKVFKNHLILNIQDNGNGFDISKKSKGIGLHTISERIKSISGEIKTDTGASGTNTIISVDIVNNG